MSSVQSFGSGGGSGSSSDSSSNSGTGGGAGGGNVEGKGTGTGFCAPDLSNWVGEVYINKYPYVPDAQQVGSIGAGVEAGIP